MTVGKAYERGSRMKKYLFIFIFKQLTVIYVVAKNKIK
jgi:hypothetical protein